ncbi:hypothetical protein EMCG_04340 [[Emmonsia] crescens]|uniref:Uncharacterized protein n=1 Tax=[Emmonsia] crescens TaxID=73230 RepID=A0A0G2IYZ6_9EURO|nr:hypothetical protein EMCG_04340 [Emmonsia crescens UAMH 3008]
MFGKSTKSSTVPSQAGSERSKSTVAPARQAARERALEIKRLQEEALSKLPIGSLYIVLYLRSDPHEPNNFHWGFYFHTAIEGGTKYHIKNFGIGWITDHGQTSGVFKSNFLCVLVHIATVPQEKHAQVHQTMKSLDSNINSIPGISCRVWLLSILQMLIQHGIVRSSSYTELEQECFTIGNQHSSRAADNDQPRPVVRSRVCAI